MKSFLIFVGILVTLGGLYLFLKFSGWWFIIILLGIGIMLGSFSMSKRGRGQQVQMGIATPFPINMEPKVLENGLPEWELKSQLDELNKNDKGEGPKVIRI